MNETETLSSDPKPSDFYRLAAGMIRSDFGFLLLIYPLLIIPVLMELSIGDRGGPALVSLLAIDRVFDLLVFYLIVVRWVQRLKTTQSWRPSLLASIKYFAIGFLLWGIIILPPFISVLSNSESASLLAMFLTVPGLIVGYRYYFYFLPLLLGVAPASNLLSETRSYTLADRAGPLRVMVAPFAITTLLVSLAQLPSPDGRSLLVSFISSALVGVFWILSSYLALAYALLFLSSPAWRDSALDPYRKERLETISVNAQTRLTNALRPKAGLRTLALALLLVMANFVRQISVPPSVKVELVSIEANQQTVIMVVNLHDPDFKFRGFNPRAFMLAGEGGRPVSTTMAKVSEVGGKSDDVNDLSGRSDVKLKLQFEIDRSAEDLRQLQDLWLWYQFSKIIYISPSLNADQSPKPTPTNEALAPA